MVLDPLLVDGDITFEKIKARVADVIGDAVALHVHAIHFPIGGGEDAVGEVVADEAVDAENEDFFHDSFSVKTAIIKDRSAAAERYCGAAESG